MTKGKPTKESFLEWLDTLIPGIRTRQWEKMQHLGEYYEHLTGKEFHTQQAVARVPAVRWLKKYFYEEIADPVFPFTRYLNEWAESKGYTIMYYRDWRGQGFLFEVKTSDRS